MPTNSFALHCEINVFFSFDQANNVFSCSLSSTVHRIWQRFQPSFVAFVTKASTAASSEFGRNIVKQDSCDGLSREPRVTGITRSMFTSSPLMQEHFSTFTRL